MDALLMCGGRGTRLDADVEKPLFEVAGKPMVDRVLAALADSRVESVSAVVSPHVPDTRRHLGSVRTIDAPGDGYVADLQYALERVGGPVLSVAADLPLLDGAVLDRVLDAHEGGSLAVCVPVARKREVGASVGTAFEADGRTLAPAGVNVVAEEDGESRFVSRDVRLAVNVNRRPDAAVAEALL